MCGCVHMCTLHSAFGEAATPELHRGCPIEPVMSDLVHCKQSGVNSEVWSSELNQKVQSWFHQRKLCFSESDSPLGDMGFVWYFFSPKLPKGFCLDSYSCVLSSGDEAKLDFKKKKKIVACKLQQIMTKSGKSLRLHHLFISNVSAVL